MDNNARLPVSAAHRRIVASVAWSLTLLIACTTPPSSQPSSVATTTRSTATVPPRATITASATETALPDPTLTATPVPPRTITLAPIRPLQNSAIVDRPARNIRALTSGERKYKTAIWGPNTEWIAAVPQDGPGMDVINSVSGEVVPIVTDTFVLEPQWTLARNQRSSGYDSGLLVHQIVDGQDELRVFHLEADQQRLNIWEQPLLTSATPLRAPAFFVDSLAYSTKGQLIVEQSDKRPHPQVPATEAIATAFALDRDAGAPALAWTPFVTILEDVQTFVALPGTPQSYAVSAPGEGLWLPRWSADAQKLVLSSIEGRIVTTTVDGSARHDLGPGIEPMWAPQGDRIVFAGQSAGSEFTTRDIFVVDWQGNEPRARLTRANDDQIYASPSWSPAGDRLAFVEIDSGKVFIADAP